LQRMRWVAAPGQAQPRCTAKSRTLAGPSIHAAVLGGAGSGLLACAAGQHAPWLPVAERLRRSRQLGGHPPARHPPTLLAQRQSAAPTGSGHFLAGRAADPLPARMGGGGSTRLNLRDCPAALWPQPGAQCRGRWPKGDLQTPKALPRGTRRVPGPRRRHRVGAQQPSRRSAELPSIGRCKHASEEKRGSDAPGAAAATAAAAITAAAFRVANPPARPPPTPSAARPSAQVAFWPAAWGEPSRREWPLGVQSEHPQTDSPAALQLRPGAQISSRRL